MAEFTVGSLCRDGSDNTDQGDSYPHKSAGSKAFAHDLMTLHNLWLAPTQMLQLTPGHCWCSCCGDVRPNTYFDPVAWDEDGKPAAYDRWCKQCQVAHDPKARPVKYCSGCRQEKRRAEFSEDERNLDGLRNASLRRCDVKC
jgi:hypothetical protein